MPPILILFQFWQKVIVKWF